MRESEIERRVVAYAEQRGWTILKLQGGSNTGKPDRVFLRNGVALFIEFKAPGKTVTRLQEWWLSRLTDQSFEAHVVDNYEDAEKLLK